MAPRLAPAHSSGGLPPILMYFPPPANLMARFISSSVSAVIISLIVSPLSGQIIGAHGFITGDKSVDFALAITQTAFVKYRRRGAFGAIGKLAFGGLLDCVFAPRPINAHRRLLCFVNIGGRAFAAFRRFAARYKLAPALVGYARAGAIFPAEVSPDIFGVNGHYVRRACHDTRAVGYKFVYAGRVFLADFAGQRKQIAPLRHRVARRMHGTAML